MPWPLLHLPWPPLPAALLPMTLPPSALVLAAAGVPLRALNVPGVKGTLREVKENLRMTRMAVRTACLWPAMPARALVIAGRVPIRWKQRNGGIQAAMEGRLTMMR